MSSTSLALTNKLLFFHSSLVANFLEVGSVEYCLLLLNRAVFRCCTIITVTTILASVYIAMLCTFTSFFCVQFVFYNSTTNSPTFTLMLTLLYLTLVLFANSSTLFALHTYLLTCIHFWSTDCNSPRTKTLLDKQ